MIDIVDPQESFSTGRYISAVIPIIERLHRMGKIPLVVGGTGLYIKAMTKGIFSGPAADWSLRNALLSMEEEGKNTLYRRLKELDPIAAGKITQNDTRRIIRALEVCLKSNDRMSDMQKELTKPLPYKFIKFGLTRDRKELYRLIEDRVTRMVESGLLAEVENILSTDPDKTPMQAIGYKEIAAHLKGDISLDEAVALIRKSTKRYAKRQFTWFRKEEDIRWVDLTGIYESSDAFSHLNDALKTLL
jgi:tRNA dimethylallyltransferase